MLAGSPGSPGGSVQKLEDAGRRLYSARNVSWALRPPLNSVHRHSDQAAKPSASQMSGHTVSVTLLPTHWCASSCSTVDSLGTRS